MFNEWKMEVDLYLTRYRENACRRACRFANPGLSPLTGIHLLVSSILVLEADANLALCHALDLFLVAQET